MLKAVIFDMDGVIIDSEPMHARAAILVLKEYNIDITMDYLQNFIGSTTLHMCETMIKEFKIDASAEELLRANNNMKELLLRQEGHIVIPYIIDLMKDLYKNGIKLIIASSSPPSAIEEVMESLQIKDYFQGYVSGSMVSHPKPAPDIFLLAAERLNVTPEDCIVIEDSYHGVTAASSAGMTCIGFINPNSGNQDLRKATMLVEGFEEINYQFLKKVYQYAHKEPVEILITNNFVIRELTERDIVDLYQIYQTLDSKDYIEGISNNLTEEIEKHKAYIENIYRFYGYGLWGVFDNKTNRLVGRCGIEYKNVDGEDVHEIGYLLDKNFQGYGYAQEFVQAVIHYCFDSLGIMRIIALIDNNNVRSIKLAKKVGMYPIGETTRNQHNYYKYEITANGN